jgi:hypothetical protein
MATQIFVRDNKWFDKDLATVRETFVTEEKTETLYTTRLNNHILETVYHAASLAGHKHYQPFTREDALSWYRSTGKVLPAGLAAIEAAQEV